MKQLLNSRHPCPLNIQRLPSFSLVQVFLPLPSIFPQGRIVQNHQQVLTERENPIRIPTGPGPSDWDVFNELPAKPSAGTWFHPGSACAQSLGSVQVTHKLQSLGILFRFVWLKLDGTGLDGLVPFTSAIDFSTRPPML